MQFCETYFYLAKLAHQTTAQGQALTGFAEKSPHLRVVFFGKILVLAVVSTDAHLIARKNHVSLHKIHLS